MAERDERLDRSKPRVVAPVDPNPKFGIIPSSPLAEQAVLAPAELPVSGKPKDAIEALNRLLARGDKERPFDEVDSIIAPNTIGATPQVFDAKGIWDYWILSPSCDALLSFRGAPTQNTPVTYAGTRWPVPVRAQKVYYVAGATGVTGLLSVWLGKWND